jgi:hypothetical protein
MITLSIPILTLILVFVIAILVWTRFRTGALAIFRGICYGIEIAAVSIWRVLSGAAPVAMASTAGVATVGIAWQLLQVVMILGLAYLLFLLVLVILVTFGTIITTGLITGHWIASLILLIALIGWGMLSLVPQFSLFRPLTFLRRWIVRPVAIGLTIYLAIGFCWLIAEQVSPRFHRWAENRMEETGNGLNKGSLQSEPEAGVFAKVTKKTEAYNKHDQAFRTVEEGTTVRVLDLKGKRTTIDSEGKTHVMFPNKHGDFVGGDDGWIPSRVIDWNGEKSKQAEQTLSSGKVTQKVTFGRNGFASAQLEPGWYTVTSQDVLVSTDKLRTFQRVVNMPSGRFKIEKEDTVVVFKGSPHTDVTIIPVS